MYRRDLEKEALSSTQLKTFIKNFMRGLGSKNPASLMGTSGATGAAAKMKLQLLKALDSVSDNVGRFTNEVSFASKNPGLYKSFKGRSILDREKIRLLNKQLGYQEREAKSLFRELLKHREEIGKLKYGPYYREILDLPGAIKPLV
jgi:hypothetical protein